MPRPKLPFLQRRVSRHGTVAYYVRLSKHDRLIRIRGDYRSEQFMQAYHAAVRGTPISAAPAAKDGKGTLGWLIEQYRKSRDWHELLAQETRNMRGPFLKHAEETAGHILLEKIKRAKIEEGISARSPNQGRHFYDTMRGLFRWAVENEHHDRNPTDGIKVKKDNGEGHVPWSIDEIEQFEKRWPLGTRQRLVLDVYLYTGLRRGDAAQLGKQHIRNNVIHLLTEKSQGKMPVFIPVQPALAASMAACPSNGLAVIATHEGMHFTKESLGNMFREAIEAAGLPITRKGSTVKGRNGHGLRKAAATIAAESGASEAELNALFGWSGHEMAQLYTRKADRKRLAARAMAKWTRPSLDDLAESGLAYLELEREQRDRCR
jgi:integrase